MQVANFTPDPISWLHVGMNGTIEPGQIVEMDESRARHILNKFSVRGLIQLQFGDDPEERKKQAMEQWRLFWEEQITKFNQHNEDQKEKGNRYAKPPAELEQKAKTLGLEILQPWRITKADDKEISALRDENKSLKDSLAELAEKVNMLISTGMEKKEPEKPTGDSEEVQEHRRKYRSLTAKHMAAWVKNNWDEIQQMPEENQFEIVTKYQDFYQVPFPDEAP